jgi:hypothetical protein
VGKTVLLDRMRVDAEATGVVSLRIEATENRSFPSMLLPQLRLALLRLSRTEHAKDLAQRALRGLAGFARAFKIRYGEIEASLGFEPEPGLADNGDLESDLQSLLHVAGEAARAASTALVLYVDEMQYVPEAELAALITALHRSAQSTVPVTMIGAGLPSLVGRLGRAKSYAERMFDFPVVGPLSPSAARTAIVVPITASGADINEDAVDLIVQQTRGYPYFLQEWGSHTWDQAPSTPITRNDVSNATVETVAALDESFFRVRFDRLTPAERRYLRAMAELGTGPHRSGDIAEILGRKVTSLGPTRNQLITKGMVWSPNHGDTAFTVPLFDEFMRRIMPDDDWRD